MSHSKGPWSIQGPCGIDKDFAIRDGNGFIIAEAWGRVGEMDRPDAHANARLIAAATTMIQVLRKFIEEFKPRECDCEETTESANACYFHRIEGDIRHVIYKAIGGE